MDRYININILTNDVLKSPTSLTHFTRDTTLAVSDICEITKNEKLLKICKSLNYFLNLFINLVMALLKPDQDLMNNINSENKIDTVSNGLTHQNECHQSLSKVSCS